MFTSIFEQNAPRKEPRHKEGELYKIIEVYGKTLKYITDIMTKQIGKTLTLNRWKCIQTSFKLPFILKKASRL